MRKHALYGFGLVVTMIVALGLVVLSSASEANALKIHHDAYWFMKRQFMYLGVGLVIAAIVAAVDYRVWRKYMALSWMFYAMVFVLLLLVFPMFGGRLINGSFRWISLGPVNLQPSELAKLAVVIIVAAWMDKAGWRVELFKRGALVPALLIAVIALPILFETDLGSTMVVGTVGMLIMLVAGTRWRYLVSMFLLGGGAFCFKLMATGNRVRRLAAWLPNWALEILGKEPNVVSGPVNTATMDPAMYQSHNALVAFRNGGITGVGLGESMQKQYYLPEAHTDFIFAIGAEELGMIFSIATFLLFVAFFVYSVYIARKAADRFGRFLVIGMAFIIFFQALFNMGVVCGALPTKGIALPFFSYGGTNMLCAFFAVGMILSVGIHSNRDTKRQVKA